MPAATPADDPSRYDGLLRRLTDLYVLGELKKPFVISTGRDATRWGYRSPSLHELADLPATAPDDLVDRLFTAGMAEVGIELRPPEVIRREQVIGYARKLAEQPTPGDTNVWFIADELPERPEFAQLAEEWRAFCRDWRERARTAGSDLLADFDRAPGTPPV